jgi:RNA polymerase sigma-70 factor (ECF subfamily)
VRTTPDPSEVPESQASSTLGGLLYADASRPRIPESEWAAHVRAMAQGDQLALRTLYELAHRLVFTLALRLTGSRETADELTVDVFHALWQRAAAYNPEAGTVLAWIMNQARSRSIDRLRHDNRRKRVNADGHVDGFDAGTDAAAMADRSEDARALREAMALLTAGERRAIQTAYYADMTHAEVATRLDEPLGTIKTRIRSGLAKLRKALMSRGQP